MRAVWRATGRAGGSPEALRLVRTHADGTLVLSTCCGYRDCRNKPDTGLAQGARSPTEEVTDADVRQHGCHMGGAWAAEAHRRGAPALAGVGSGQGPHTRLWGPDGAAVVAVGKTGVPGTESCGWEWGSRLRMQCTGFP